MISSETVLRFSGHDTFHCKEQWMLKGLQLSNNKNSNSVFRESDSILKLGVGKNMVRSIYHWLRAFNLIDQDVNPTDFANLLFLKTEMDPFIEHEGSLWLLQYYICANEYASIFKIIFSDYFKDKATLEFSETQILRYVDKELKDNNQKSISYKTLETDFKVFIRSYVAPVKNQKTVEDDFNIPLLSLNLIVNTGRQNEKGESVYRINKQPHNIPVEIIAYCLLTEFKGESAFNFDDIRKTIGAYLCLTNDHLDNILIKLSENHPQFVYKDDAGVRQIQVKGKKLKFKEELLKKYYGLLK